MVATIASVLILVSWTISLLHRWMRGGRLWYYPESRSGRVVFGFPWLIVLAVSVLALFHRISPDVFMAILAIATFLDLSYSFWRRELASAISRRASLA